MIQANEKEQLLVAMKTVKTKRMYERYQAVYLYIQDYSIKEITKMIGRSEKTIYNYVNAYKEKGLNGLVIGQSPGAPRKLSPEQEQELVGVIASKRPNDVGLVAKRTWTLALITAFIKREWNVSYTLRGVSRLLQDVGICYKKSPHALEKSKRIKQ